MNNTTQTESVSHPFTIAGLGLAPFKFVGMGQQNRQYSEVVLNAAEVYAGGYAVTTKAGGTCDYCGHAILDMYNVQSADGNRFHVGSDCIAKIAAHSPILAGAVKSKVSHIRKMQAEKRSAAKVNAAFASLALPSVQASLASQAHPKRSGATMLDYVQWLLEHAGRAGQLRAAKLVSAVV